MIRTVQLVPNWVREILCTSIVGIQGGHYVVFYIFLRDYGYKVLY